MCLSECLRNGLVAIWSEAFLRFSAVVSGGGDVGQELGRMSGGELVWGMGRVCVCVKISLPLVDTLSDRPKPSASVGLKLKAPCLCGQN